MNWWVSGFCFGAAFAVITLHVFGSNSAIYRNGMVGCRLEPIRCEKLYQAHLAEQRAQQLQSQAYELGKNR